MLLNPASNDIFNFARPPLSFDFQYDTKIVNVAAYVFDMNSRFNFPSEGFSHTLIKVEKRNICEEAGSD